MMLRLSSSPLRLTFGLLLIALAIFLTIRPALAQTNSGSTSTSSTSSTTTGGSVTNFSCVGSKAQGVLYDATSSCPTTLKTNNIFSFIVCNLEHLSANLMGTMYCNIISQLKPAVMGMLTLAVLFFGVGFTIGVIPATARDFQIFLLKMILVFVFATQSDYLIGFGYNILITGMREAAALAVSTMYNKIGSNGQVVSSGFAATPAAANLGYAFYTYMDNFLGMAMHFATDSVGVSNTTSGTTTTSNPCQNAVFAVLAIMAVAFPPIFYIGVMIIFRIALTFLRAVFAYIYAVVGIVFLLTMSPFFLSFALFRATESFFQRWLGYLVSFAFQVVVLFAFLGFVLSINVGSLSKGLTNIIVFDKVTYESTAIRLPWHYCTICDFQVVGPNGQTYNTDSQYGVNLITSGTLQCRQPVTPISVLNAMAPGMAATTTNTTTNTTTTTSITGAQTQAIQKALLKFATTGLLSLLILAYILEYILNFVPFLAQLLASGLFATYAPQLGGSDSLGQRQGVDMPGGKLIDTFEQGFTDGYSSAGQFSTSVVSTTQGLTTAVRRTIMGGGGGGDDLPKTAGASDPGFIQRFSGFMLGADDDQSQ